MSEQELKISYYMVAWLDLPGQREKIKKIPDIPSTNVERGSFRKHLHEALNPVKEFRAMIEGLCVGRSGTTSDKITNPKWDIIAQSIWSRHSQISIGREFISDAALLKVSLEESPNFDPLCSVLAICDVVQVLILGCLSNRSSVRGSIDVHVGFDIDPDSLYGPAVVNAYELETEYADYPRIVFGPGFMRYLEYKKRQLD